ncbi:hypothetical protein HF086_017974 [Spodoptera exigua]|uniref:Tetratricopeptide repeat protein 39B n=1 Tax=Spodoptera exigua TaxID=7107 RepID=A0A922M125_SPOEX|nr:hypothetical protein HF086_017974 [Spodoptera exigua]
MTLRQEAPPPLASPLLHDAVAGDSSPPLADEQFEDEFEDATDELPDATPDLHTAFNDCEVAIRKFFNNDLTGAMTIMKPWQRTSVYHSLGAAIFEFIPAMLTFDSSQINNALAALKIAIAICHEQRKNYTFVESIGTIIKKPNYAAYTDMEAHAELCYAETLMLQAAMTIMEGEDLTGFIKGTIKIKNCYNSYRECSKILDKKQWETEESKIQFQSGVRLGVATFNVMISLLPPKIISVLEFVGFSGNKSLGLAELEAGSRAPGMRSVLCDLTLLGYHLVICHFIGAIGDLPACERILHKQLKVFPESVWFLIFKGRIELIRGQFDTAIDTYNRAVSSQRDWRQFHHVCFWEIMWVNRLLEESTWSRTIYSYSKAAMLLQLDDITVAEKKQCSELMRNASYYKQRIAGKSLPMEKFVIKRGARYQAQGGRLVLPAIELLCLWNMFQILAKNERDAQNVLKNDLKEDTFLLPYTLSEMAMCHYQLGDKDRALQMLQEARKKYSGYSLESRLHFRLHSKLDYIKNGSQGAIASHTGSSS